MKRWRSLGAGLSIALLLAGCAADQESLTEGNGATAAPLTTVQRWDSRFDAFVEALKADLAKNHAYGVSAAVMENGVVTFAAAFGSKDANGVEPLTTSTLMQIGSTTKQLTAAAVLRQVQARKINLEDSLERLLPQLEFKLNGTWDEHLTLHQMLSQQSGLADQSFGEVASEDDDLANFSYGGFSAQEYRMNPSGAFWNYSNPNFSLAGLIAEAHDTRHYADIMREDIFLPLGMSRTYARKSEVEQDGDYAQSYGFGLDDSTDAVPGNVSLEQVLDAAFIRPAGFVWSTPTQMMKWADFLMKGNRRVLSDKFRRQITTPQVDTLYGEGRLLGYGAAYGYGMFVESGYLSGDGKWYQMPVWQHGGNTSSFTNDLFILPNQAMAIAISVSGVGTNFSSSIDTAVTTLASLPKASEFPMPAIDYTQFDDHVGIYNDPWTVGKVIVTRDGNALHVNVPAAEELGIVVTPELIPISSDLFLVIVDGAPMDLTFVRSRAHGASTYIRNRGFVATRVDKHAEYRQHASRESVARWIRHAHRAPMRLAPALVRAQAEQHKRATKDQ